MGKETGISWTKHTFNPWWGCTKVSAGCDHCYADTLAHRYGHDIWGPGKPRRFFGEKHWNEPLKWNRDAEKAGTIDLVFCGSMCDVMDAEVSDRERGALWQLIDDTPFLHWQLLTKRPNLIVKQMPESWKESPPANVWWGTSVEDERVLWRIGHLLQVPAAVRFLSVEPMLGAVDLEEWFYKPVADRKYPDCTCEGEFAPCEVCDALGPWASLDWVIYGGESGPGARLMSASWMKLGIDQCVSASVAVFVKQMGTVAAQQMGLKSHKGDDPSEWPAEFQIQEFPQHYHNCLEALKVEVPL